MGDKKEARPRVADRRKGMLAEATKKPKSQRNNRMGLKSKRKILKDMMDRRPNSNLFVGVQEKFVVAIEILVTTNICP